MGNVRPFVAPKIAASFSRPAPKVARPAEWRRFRFATAQAALDAVQAIADKWAHLKADDEVRAEQVEQDSVRDILWGWYSEDYSRLQHKVADVGRVFGCEKSWVARVRRAFMAEYGIEKPPTKTALVERYFRENPNAINEPGVEIAARFGVTTSIVSTVRKRLRA